jgi:hypothetical protein
MSKLLRVFRFSVRALQRGAHSGLSTARCRVVSSQTCAGVLRHFANPREHTDACALTLDRRRPAWRRRAVCSLIRVTLSKLPGTASRSSSAGQTDARRDEAEVGLVADVATDDDNDDGHMNNLTPGGALIATSRENNDGSRCDDDEVQRSVWWSVRWSGPRPAFR